MTFKEILLESRQNYTKKSKIVVLIFRFSTYYTSSNIFKKLIGAVFICLNTIINEFFFSVEIPHTTKIGKGLKIWHPHGIVINKGCIIGNNFEIRHNCTCGANKLAIPNKFLIGDNVSMGVNSCILGDDIRIGDNVLVGAGVILMSSVLSNHYVIGNKPIIKVLKDRS
ncbi:hypothetical protein ACR789_22475 [Sphingobacterium siyangense]|jgi:putative colanic acid biosynthesis acetyltransferase WcaB|uniref:Uncharacterized protein n=2 Tax=Sphingobacterium TaxID=28453 RepID=A0ACD5BWV2_9SPHI|nr:serine acetyltransferase [Sphingobacterium multivorum]VXC33366.1 putative colanic acid biosynthesis acetyltransferase WcaB [Sphingobacterium multivorum]